MAALSLSRSIAARAAADNGDATPFGSTAKPPPMASLITGDAPCGPTAKPPPMASLITGDAPCGPTAKLPPMPSLNTGDAPYGPTAKLPPTVVTCGLRRRVECEKHQQPRHNKVNVGCA
jgi:hypothetical protein